MLYANEWNEVINLLMSLMYSLSLVVEKFVQVENNTEASSGAQILVFYFILLQRNIKLSNQLNFDNNKIFF